MAATANLNPSRSVAAVDGDGGPDDRCCRNGRFHRSTHSPAVQNAVADATKTRACFLVARFPKPRQLFEPIHDFLRRPLHAHAKTEDIALLLVRLDCADSDEVAQAFRFDGARDSDMMSPRASGLAGW